MSVKCVTSEEAGGYLEQVGLQIGSWNELKYASTNERRWSSCAAPKSALELYVFCQHLVGWLISGDWKILQIDRSNGFAVDESFMLGKLMLGKSGLTDLSEKSSFLFEYTKEESSNFCMDLLVADVIFCLLLFEGHGYLASAGSSDYLGIQDGYVYFISRESGESRSECLLSSLQSNPLIIPDWVQSQRAAT